MDRDSPRPRPKKAGDRFVLRRLAATAAPALLVLLAAALQDSPLPRAASAQTQRNINRRLPVEIERPPTRRPPKDRDQPQQAPQVSLSASPNSVTLCPNMPSRVRLTVSGLGRAAQSLEYQWRASGGQIKSGGPSADWDLSGLKAGTYTAAVTLSPRTPAAASQSLQRQVRVTVNECREAPPACPDIQLSCPRSVAEGTAAVFTAGVKGGRPREQVTTGWTISAGTVSQQEGRRARVGTRGLGGQWIKARFEAGGYGFNCSATCETFVEPRPTPTPFVKDDDGGATGDVTPTPESERTPTPEPTPIPSPSIVGVITPTPEVSGGILDATTTPTPEASPTPGTSPSPTPSTGASPSATAPPSGTAPDADQPGATATPMTAPVAQSFFRRNLWPIVAAVLLGLLALIAFKLLTGRRSVGGGRWTRRAPPPPPDDGRTDEAVVDDETSESAVGGGVVRGQSDELLCSVYAPFRAAPGDGFVVQAFAHLASEVALLEGLAREAQQNAERRGAKGLGMVERGQELGFHLQMPGLEVDGPSQSIIWQGEVESAQFGVTVPESFRPRTLSCKLTVTSRSVPLGHIRFGFEVVGAEAPRPAADEEALKAYHRFVRYRRAFISYASEDRVEVLRCVQMLTLLKIECIQDVLSLEPGQRWQDGLYRNIDASDVLFLFWSAAASRSEWVRKEVEYALGLKAGVDERPPEIVPVILQGPPEVPPPSYLPDLHFNDPFAFFIKGELAMREAAKEG